MQMKQSKIIRLLTLAYGLALASLAAPSAWAYGLLSDEARKRQNAQEEALRSSAGFNSASPNAAAEIVATVIQAFIGLLGVIFLVLIVYAGYNWMTANGDEGKVSKAKDTITRAIIGLIIVLAAYSITYFVFGNLDKVVSTT